MVAASHEAVNKDFRLADMYSTVQGALQKVDKYTARQRLPRLTKRCACAVEGNKFQHFLPPKKGRGVRSGISNVP